MSEENKDDKKESKDTNDFGDMFFTDGNKPKKPDVDVSKEFDKEDTEFTTKGSNIKFDKPYDIKFTIGADIFTNVINFMKAINLDILYKIKKDGIRLYTRDVANTHVSAIKFKRTEFAEYDISKLNFNETDEYLVYVDMSFIDDLSIKKGYPVDVYIDMTESKRLYIVCDKDIVWRRLNSMTDSDNVIDTYKKEEDIINGFVSNKNMKKIVYNFVSFKDLLNSLNKKYDSKDKKSSGSVILQATSSRVGFTIEDELKGGEFWLQGNNVVIFPLEDVSVELSIEYIQIFNILQLNNQVNTYLDSSLPAVFTTRLGGGSITVFFIIAPRIDNEN